MYLYLIIIVVYYISSLNKTLATTGLAANVSHKVF